MCFVELCIHNTITLKKKKLNKNKSSTFKSLFPLNFCLILETIYVYLTIPPESNLETIQFLQSIIV